MKNYLPDVYTIELDFWQNDGHVTGNPPRQHYQLFLYDETGPYAETQSEIASIEFGEGYVAWRYKAPSNDVREGRLDNIPGNLNTWNHFSLSFNQRALKVYINGVRTTNIPSVAGAKYFAIHKNAYGDHKSAITNIRLAKGAVPLYDRMMSDGKFITYGITFDVGKSTIKPESMGEINRIATLLKENPALKFSVEGHTDSTGSAATNQTLSEARSQAVVDKLVSMGIVADRLKAAGKGQSSPIADNGTDEGRAKNRRVEFVILIPIKFAVANNKI
jgi:outer membrane protein OmpA-like peptidoglycan-associated protein